jgi:hypothetical protein
MQPGGSLLHSQEPATCAYTKQYQGIGPSARPCEMFHNILRFHGVELLASHPAS